MEQLDNFELPTLEVDDIEALIKLNDKQILMSHRICDKCGHSKDTYGGKTCSKGHFICHSCASGHEHCPLCGHTLR
jgi:transposase-like protein